MSLNFHWFQNGQLSNLKERKNLQGRNPAQRNMLFSLTRFLSSRRSERPNHGHFELDFDHFGLIYTYIWMNWGENIRIKIYIYQKKSLICTENSSKNRVKNGRIQFKIAELSRDIQGSKFGFE